MTMWEFQTIWVPARNKLYPQPQGPTDASRLLREALGARAIKEHTDFFRKVDYDYPMDEELKNVLLLLAGPHAHTILKAYRIRKGLEGA